MMSFLIGSSVGSRENPDDALRVRWFYCAWKAAMAVLTHLHDILCLSWEGRAAKIYTTGG
jgi:hypothetical protein